MAGRALSERFVQCARRHDVAPLSVFEDYDARCSGLIRPEHFCQALTSLHCAFTQSELAIVLQRYGSSGSISYRQFCADLPRPSLGGASSESDLRRFRAVLRATDFNLHDLLRGRDRAHLGRVDLSVFMSAVDGSELTQSVARAYIDRSSGQVDYVALQRDLDALPRESREPIHSRFARALRENSIDLTAELTRPPPMKTWFVPPSEAVRFLGALGLGFATADLRKIVLPFERGGQIDLSELAESLAGEPQKAEDPPEKVAKEIVDVEIVLGRIKDAVRGRKLKLRELLIDERERLNGKMIRLDFYHTLNKVRIEFDATERVALENEFLLPNGEFDVDAFVARVDPVVTRSGPRVEDVTARLAGFLSESAIDLPGRLWIGDRERSGEIAISRFSQALKSIGFELSEAELRQITHTYGNGHAIKWHKLCTDLGFTGELAPEKVAILNEIRAVATRYAIDLPGEFRAFDRQRSGLLAVSLFRRVLDSLPSRLPLDRVNFLVHSYLSGNLVDYKAFLSDIERAGEVSQRPVKNPQKLNNVEVGQVDKLLEIVKENLAARRQNARNFFSDLQTPMIADQEFRSRLVANRIVVNRGEVAAIADRYRDGGMIDWVHFCEDIGAGAHHRLEIV
jgi:Ca2+-binding EF-hand superfamily protein